MDIWDLRHHFELAVGLATPGATVRVAAGTGWEAVAPDEAVVGTAGPVEADAPRWAAPLFGLEVNVVVAPPPLARYQPLSTLPPVLRDLSLVVPGGVSAAAVEAVLRREGGALLARLDVLDEYRGAGLPPGTRGVTWRCTFRAPDRTLTERETVAVLDGMLRAAEESLGVRRRQT